MGSETSFELAKKIKKFLPSAKQNVSQAKGNEENEEKKNDLNENQPKPMQNEDLQQEQEIAEQNVETIDEVKHIHQIRRLDILIGEYYASFGVKDYFDKTNGDGRFMKYAMDLLDNGLIKVDKSNIFADLFDKAKDPFADKPVFVNKDINAPPPEKEFIYANFDLNNFPISDDIHYNMSAKQNVVFFVLKYCFIYGSVPDNQLINQWVQIHVKPNVLGDKSNKKCICGNMLFKLYDSASFWDGRGIRCDICSDKIQNNDPFWHCHDTDNAFHGFGYDICDGCIVNYDNNNDIYNECKYDNLNNMKYIYDSCTKDITNCIHLQQFIDVHTMHSNSNKYNVNMDKRIILEITNHFLHLLHLHDRDEDFEYIYNKMGECDISNCAMFRRNCRDRFDEKYNQTPEYKQSDDHLPANKYEQILDKMHCFFMHSFDSGNRLTIEQKQMVERSAEEIKTADNDQFLNTKILTINKILPENSANKIRNVRFNQMFTEQNLEMDKDSQNNHIYQFGSSFTYGYPGELDNYNTKLWPPNRFQPIYKSLKEELISNKFSKLNIQQFNSEYNKAMIHFNSWYCKKTFVPKIKEYKRSANAKLIFHVQYVLALMIYCNFDHLSYEFSKTYRGGQEKIRRGTYSYVQRSVHRYFYFLGKYIKIACREFANSFYGSTTFYHGVGEQLCPEASIKIKAKGPISTSTSIEVAANFANQNQGLILAFQFEYEFQATPFSLSWLSDFANEHEHLFVQSKHTLKLQNIINLKTGMEYSCIFTSINILNNAFGSGFSDEEIMSDNIIHLIAGIMSNQLSYTMSQYKPFHSLSVYGSKLCDTFFKQISYFYMNMERKAQRIVNLTEFPFCLKHEWIDKQLLAALFPVLHGIDLSNINLSVYILNDINAIFKNQNTFPNLWNIQITPNEDSELSSKEAVNQYNDTFRALNVSIMACVHEYNSTTIHITKHSDYNDLTYFILKLILLDDLFYFKDSNNEIVNLLKMSMTNDILETRSPNYVEQNVFSKITGSGIDDICVTKKGIFNNDPKFSLYHYLYDPKTQWVNIDLIHKLFGFPKSFYEVKTIKIANVKLSEWAMDTLLFVLSNDKTSKWLTITIMDGNETEELKYLDPPEEWTGTGYTYAGWPESDSSLIIIDILRKVTHYNEEDNIWKHDWGNLSVLHQYIDQLEKENDSNSHSTLLARYYMNQLIASYCVLKYRKQFEMIGFTMQYFIAYNQFNAESRIDITRQ
eukprot:93475_1